MSTLENKRRSTSTVIRIATPEDVPQIEHLDSFSKSPTRHIHRDMQKYFGSVDPSTHERTVIFLMEIEGETVGKAELMLPPQDFINATGYIKRVIVHPDQRGKGLAQQLMKHVITFAKEELKLDGVELHVWDQNIPAIKLYEELGFEMQHRELYYRLNLP